MRASRAYLAGLGTTTVLVAGAVLLLVVASAFFAFQGWSPGAAGERIAALIVGDPPTSLNLEEPLQTALAAPGATTAAPAPRRSAAASARGEVPAASDGPEAGGAGTVGGDGGTAGEQRTGTGGRDVESAPRTVGAPEPRLEGRLPPPVPPASGGPVRLDGLSELAVDVGDLGEGLTGGLGSTVGSVEPGFGEAITDAGRGLSDLVGSLGAPR